MKFNKWFLPLFFIAFYLLPLGQRPLWSPDETRYAEISREMVQTQDWIVPHFLGLRYFEKPIAGYWLNSLSQQVFGETNFAVRFASAFSTGLSALLVCFLAMRLWNDQTTARIASLIYLSTLLVFGIGTYSVLDAMLTLSLNAAMVCYFLAVRADSSRKKIIGYLLLGLACGLGFLLKGFIALAIPVIAILPWAFYQERIRELLIYGWLTVLSALVISAPWALAIYQREPDYWHYFFWVEHIQRFSADDAQHKSPFWFYLPVLLLACLPWTGLLPGAVKHLWKQAKTDTGLCYLLSWFLLPLIFFSLAKGKLVTYLLPCLAPLVLLLARYLGSYLQSTKTRSLSGNAWVNLLFGLLGIAALIFTRISPDNAVYEPQESVQFGIALAMFAGWALLGGVQLANPPRFWFLSALAPMLLGLGLPWAMPLSLLDAELPQNFVQRHHDSLKSAQFLVSNDIGIASAMAWETKRSDITLFDKTGELYYGLAYPDAQGRFVPRPEFPAWIQQMRQQGSIAIIIDAHPSTLPTDLPAADEQIHSYRFTLLVYHRQTP